MHGRDHFGVPDYVSFDSNDHIPFPPDYIVDSELPCSSNDLDSGAITMVESSWTYVKPAILG